MSDHREVLANTTRAVFGREGGVASGVLRRDRIIAKVAHLPVEDRVPEAYRLGYDAGYHAHAKRAKSRSKAQEQG